MPGGGDACRAKEVDMSTSTELTTDLQQARRLLDKIERGVRQPSSLTGWDLAYIEYAGRPDCVWVRNWTDKVKRLARDHDGSITGTPGEHVDLMDEQWDGLVLAQAE